MSININNLDILDKDNLKAEWPGDGIVYSGDTKFVKEQIPEEEYVSPQLAAAILGLNNTASPTHATSKHENMWTDIDAQEIYLNEKPTCYLIFGKPGLDAFSLGEALSKKINCIHLCPTSIINDEILQSSLTGKCLDFHMRHNYLCTYRTIIKMLKQKLTSPAIKHRGYVISGIPIVTASEKPVTLIENKYGEKAVFNADDILSDIIVNLKKKKPKKPSSETSQSSLNNMGEEEDVEEEVVDEEAEDNEEEEVTAELPKFLLCTCDRVFFSAKPFLETEQAILLQQIQELFNLNIQPDIIIYITCPDADVLTKKQHKYINYKNSQRTVHQFFTKVNSDSDLKWPSLYILSDYENPHDMHVFNPKYNCRPPLNFAEKSEVQLCNYRDYISQYIESKILEYDPKQVIKLDGRTSTYQMIHQIKERLLLMDINPVIIPEPLYIEEPPEDLGEFWEMVKESQTIQSGGVLNFRRYPSPWFNRCPVELKKRKSDQGKPKFAVKFCKHVYLLSSPDNFILFCRNPRPFLKMKYLEPTCRIIVIGTKSSGKTMVAECLSWLFDCPVLNFQSLLEIERDKKRQMYNINIFSEIIATVEEARFIRRENQELERKENLNQWIESMKIHLNSYIKLLKKRIQPNLKSSKSTVKGQEGDEEDLEIQVDEKEAKEEVEKEIKEEGEKEIKEEGEKGEKKTKKRKKEDKIEDVEEDPEILNKLHALKEPLSFLPIDFDNVEECEALLENQVLQEYAPTELKTVTMQPIVPVLGDEDIMEAISDYIAANDLLKELEPTTEELMTEIIKFISKIDSHHKHETDSKESYGKYIIDGLPSDSEYWAFLEEDRLLPDYTIALIENRELEPEIILHYLNLEKCNKNYYETISSVKDPLILSKLQTKQFPNMTPTNMLIVLNDLIDSHINSFNDPAIEENAINPEIMTTFAESIEKFKMDWDSLKIKLEETSKCFIEIELENKTDIEVLEQMLLKLRQCYFLTGELNEDDVVEDENEDVTPKDLLNYNNAQNVCETNIYCPITYYNHGSLWPGKNEFSLKYDNKIHYFAKEEFLEQFQTDVTKYQAYNKPFKKLPKLKICITGCIGSGASSLSKRIATELGLLYIDFVKFINDNYLPRHYKKVGRIYENPFLDGPLEEEGLVEFQMDEENPNLLTDILSNEVELRRIFYNYFERSQPILPLITHTIIEKLWHDEPYVKTGFVLDGYPRLPQDVEDLMQCNCIPDMVIELENDVESCIGRLAPTMLKKWKSQLKQAKEVHLKEMQEEKSMWMDFITKQIAIRLIIDEILVNVIEALPKIEEEARDDEEPKVGEEPKDDEERTHSAQSFAFDVDKKGVDAKLYIAYNEMIEQHPPPEDTREWENVEDEHEKIISRLEIIHETDSENMEALREVIEESNINFLTINSSVPIHKLFRVTLSKLSTLRNRTQSFFEETYIISSDIAEILLSQGYCFVSKFGRLCPVYVYENPETTFNPLKINRRKGKIFPIIHRAYIYYVGGEDNVIKFRTDPLKYISCDAIKSYHPYPLRIGVIGTPKAGKSSLAASISKNNNLLCISRGQALRSILENMYWTELGIKISKKLNEGETVDSDLIMSAVQTVAIDHRTVTNGFVLDGFPDTPYEAMILAKNGLYPNIIFDVSANKEIILGRSQNEIYHNIIKYKPPYSHPFIENRFLRWSDQSYKIRQWINNDYQNSFYINGNKSKWQSLQAANNTIKEVHARIYYYLANVETKIVPANALAISNEIFEQKQSTFKNMCPACLRSNVFRHSGYPTDKTGVVQFENKFFWICAEHMDLVIAYPNYYLSKEIEIPEIPAVVKTINASNIYENGICIVTYAEQLPKQILERGTNQFAASYKGKTYLFCREICLQKFLDKPHLYADIAVFHGSDWFPRLSLKKLPNLGYLEQTLANILTEACCSVNAIRPKYPGLSFPVSAAIYIAIYLKSKNTRLPKEQHEFYKKHLKSFVARSKLILDLGLRMRSMENPFADYPRCNHRTPKYYSPLPSMQVRRVPVPDERFDYLCEFHKPASKVPAFLNVVDIAGLVRGAAEGQGLGNAFLSHIKACDAILNLCRAFDDEDVIHVDGDVNPVRDLETIGEELRLKDEEELLKNIEKLDRVANRGNDKKLKPEYDTLQKVKTVLVDEKKHIRFGDWSAADIEILNKYLFLTSKPALYLVNLSEKDYIRKKNKWLPKLKEWIDKNDPGAPLIPFSGVYETKLVEMDAAERQAYLKENNLSSALDKIIVQGYKALQLEYFFTAGPDEVKAWTIQKGTKAPQAAGRIHTDFEKGFIMAEVMHFKDFKEEGTEAACKAAGKYRQQGRNYLVEDGDIIFFKFNAGAGLKDAKKK